MSTDEEDENQLIPYDSLKIDCITSPDDPERCQTNDSRGQCGKKGAMLQDGGRAKYCRIHGGHNEQVAQAATSTRNYMLGIYQQRVNEFADSDKVKSLREEIGITRLLIERRFSLIKDDNDLLLQSQAINELVARVDKLVTNCHKIENSMGELLDKSDIIQFATEIIAIVSRHVTDPIVIGHIGSEIAQVAKRVGNPMIDVEYAGGD